MLLARVLSHFVDTGCLTLIDASGREHKVEGIHDGPHVTARFHSRAAEIKAGLLPRLCIGEAFMDGTFTIEEGSVYDFLNVATSGVSKHGWHPTMRLLGRIDTFLRKLQQINPAGKSKRNVSHHYDIGDALYELFLDEDRQYSCAYFPRPGMTLEEAQSAKKQHIETKLRIEPGMTVLDIGSGWGGLACEIAKLSGAKVTGLTLSENQFNYATEKAKRMGLSDLVTFKLQDYRLETGTYDRIVSVGMFEHVGLPHYQTFFDKVHECLAPDGIALLHTIGDLEGPGATNPWIRKYIFPGGYTPSLSEIMPSVELSKLRTMDVEVMRLHYAETLRHWRERFLANRDKALELYDARFCRMWEYYLASCEVAFRNLSQVVFQLQLTRDANILPMSRAYMYEDAAAPKRTANRKQRSRAA